MHPPQLMPSSSVRICWVSACSMPMHASEAVLQGSCDWGLGCEGWPRCTHRCLRSRRRRRPPFEDDFGAEGEDEGEEEEGGDEEALRHRKLLLRHLQE